MQLIVGSGIDVDGIATRGKHVTIYADAVRRLQPAGGTLRWLCLHATLPSQRASEIAA